MVTGATIIALIILAPLIFQVWAVRRPISVSENADKLTIGLIRNFTLHHVTGVVLAADSETVIRRTTEYEKNTWMVISQTDLSTQYETIYIQTHDGRIWPVSIVNYNFRPPVGSVVSVWNTSRGSKDFTVAAINHTANGAESVNDQQLYEVMKSGWSQIVFVLYLCALAIPIAILTVVGKGLPFLILVVLLVMYVRGLRQTQRKYKGAGLNPIRKVSRQEATAYQPAAD